MAKARIPNVIELRIVVSLLQSPFGRRMIAQRFDPLLRASWKSVPAFSGPAGIQQEHTTAPVISLLHFKNPAFGGESLERSGDRAIGSSNRAANSSDDPMTRWPDLYHVTLGHQHAGFLSRHKWLG